MSDRQQGRDPATLERHFGSDEDLVPLWIAEPSVELVPDKMTLIIIHMLTSK